MSLAIILTVLVEGCLDKIVIEELLNSAGLDESNRYVTMRGGKENVVKSAVKFLEEITSGRLNTGILIVIDADESAYLTLRNIRGSLTRVARLSEKPLSQHIYPIQVGEHIVGGLLTWCVSDASNSCTGTIENVIGEALHNAHGCTRDYTRIPSELQCHRNCSPRFNRVAEKLSLIVALAACSGKGTLVLADRKCGLDLARPVRGIIGAEPLRSIAHELHKLLELLGIPG